MEGIRGRYERTLRQRAAGELEEERAEFWTNICAAINEAKIRELDEKRYMRRYVEIGN